MKAPLLLILVPVLAITWWITATDDTAVSEPSGPAGQANVVVPHNPFRSVDEPAHIEPISSDSHNETAFVAEDAMPSTACGENCARVVELVKFHASDEEYETALGLVDDLTIHLRGNTQLQQELLELAPTVSSGARKIIINAFAHLDASERQALGNALLGSSYRLNRLDGVSLLSTPENMNQSVAHEFAQLVVTEQDDLIREAMVRALDQTELFSGDQQVVDALSHISATDNNENVRGTALLAGSRISDSPEDMLGDSLAAIRSGSAVSQSFGVRSLEEIVMRQSYDNTGDGMGLSLRGELDAEQLFDELMTPAFDGLPDDLRRSIDNLAEQYFTGGS